MTAPDVARIIGQAIDRNDPAALGALLGEPADSCPADYDARVLARMDPPEGPAAAAPHLSRRCRTIKFPSSTPARRDEIIDDVFDCDTLAQLDEVIEEIRPDYAPTPQRCAEKTIRSSSRFGWRSRRDGRSLGVG